MERFFNTAGPQLPMQVFLQRVVNVDEGHIVVFDRDGSKLWDERIWHRTAECHGRTIVWWGM